MSENFVKAVVHCITKDDDGREELWQPYYEEIAKQTIDAAKHSDFVVLTHATYRQTHREFCVKKLIEGGATKENITVLYLTINPDVKLKGLYYRSKERIEYGGMMFGDHMRTYGWEGEGDITLSEYIKFKKENFPRSAGNDLFQGIPDGYGKTVDVSGRDMSHLDGVDDALGLVGKRNDKTLTFEEIRDKVKVVDQKRDQDHAATGAQEINVNFFAEARSMLEDDNDDDEDGTDNGDSDCDYNVINSKEEIEKVAKRRSSLISVEYLERELRLSNLNSSTPSKGDIKEKEKKQLMKSRRVSLIKTGKIEL